MLIQGLFCLFLIKNLCCGMWVHIKIAQPGDLNGVFMVNKQIDPIIKIK